MSDLLASVAVAIGASDVTSLLVMVTFTLALALGGAWSLRHARAAVRHVLLAVTFAMLFVLPIASVAIPPRAVGFRSARLPHRRRHLRSPFRPFPSCHRHLQRAVTAHRATRRQDGASAGLRCWRWRGPRAPC